MARVVMNASLSEPRDLDSPAQIAGFIEAFYAKVLADPQLAPIFIDVAGIDLQVHLGHICQYWEKLLLGGADYRRHTMNIHRALNAQRQLHSADFARWLSLFEQSVDERYQGPKAERALVVARHIAANMQRTLAAESGAADDVAGPLPAVGSNDRSDHRD